MQKLQIALDIVLIVLLLVFIYFIYLDNIGWDNIWKIMALSGFAYFTYLFARVHIYEWQIIKCYKERDEIIRKVKDQPIPLPLMDGQRRNAELEAQGEISLIERKRKYALEKIPFLKV